MVNSLFQFRPIVSCFQLNTNSYLSCPPPPLSRQLQQPLPKLSHRPFHAFKIEKDDGALPTRFLPMVSPSSLPATASSSSLSSPSDPSTSKPSPSTEIEVEQKFCVTASNIRDMEERLWSLGFRPSNNSNTNNSGEEYDKDENQGKTTTTDATKLRFVDFYYDLPQPLWVLTKRDCWLRYRRLIDDPLPTLVNNGNGSDYHNECAERKYRGAWQLKRGLVLPQQGNGDKHSGDTEGSTATAYEETQGDAAIEMVLSILDEAINAAKKSTDLHRWTSMPESTKDEDVEEDRSFDPLIPPTFPSSRRRGYALVPFATIETTRSSWVWKGNTSTSLDTNSMNGSVKDTQNTIVSKDGDFDGLKVDIDGTDFGYMVGEVEGIVNDEKFVKAMKEKIRRLVCKLVVEPTGISGDIDDTNAEYLDQVLAPAKGKLETYLIQTNKEHYDACVSAGSLQ